MQTLERFDKPGLASSEAVLASLPEAPRALTATGVRGALWLRFFVLALSICSYGFVAQYLWSVYSEEASVWAWCLFCALIPVVFGFLPYGLILSMRRRLKSFDRFARIYRDGVPALGHVNTISSVSGREQDCHYVESGYSSVSKVRIDYTFEVDGAIKTGTVILHSQSARHLMPNGEICVLYLAGDPAQSMIYPVPGRELFL